MELGESDYKCSLANTKCDLKYKELETNGIKEKIAGILDFLKVNKTDLIIVENVLKRLDILLVDPDFRTNISKEVAILF